MRNKIRKKLKPRISKMVREHIADAAMVLKHFFDYSDEAANKYVQKWLKQVGNQNWAILLCHDYSFTLAASYVHGGRDYYVDNDADDETWKKYLEMMQTEEWKEERKKFIKRRIDYEGDDE